MPISEPEPGKPVDWWLVRCPQCQAVIRVPHADLESSSGLVCGACVRLMKVTDRTVELLDYIVGNRHDERSRPDRETPAANSATSTTPAASTAPVASTTSTALTASEAGSSGEKAARSSQKNGAGKALDVSAADDGGPRGTLIMLGALAAVLVLATLLFFAFSDSSGDDPPRQQSSASLATTGKKADRAAASPVAATGEAGKADPADGAARADPARQRAFEDEAYELVRRFLEAGSVEEQLALPRVESLFEDGLEAFLASEAAPDGHRRLRLAKVGSTSITGPGRCVVLVEDSRFRNYQLVCQLRESGTALDLGASFGLGELSWEELDRPGQGDSAVMRVHIVADAYYNFAFRDPGRWTSWRLSLPDQSKSYFGYTEVGSEADRMIKGQFLLAAREAKVPVTDLESQSIMARLALDPDNARHDQFEIVELISRNWVEGDRVPSADEAEGEEFGGGPVGSSR